MHGSVQHQDWPWPPRRQPLRPCSATARQGSPVYNEQCLEGGFSPLAPHTDPSRLHPQRARRDITVDLQQASAAAEPGPSPRLLTPAQPVNVPEATPIMTIGVPRRASGTYTPLASHPDSSPPNAERFLTPQTTPASPDGETCVGYTPHTCLADCDSHACVGTARHLCTKQRVHNL